MKMYKTVGWREIKELEVVKADENNVWLLPLDSESKYECKRNFRKVERKNHQWQFWNTLEEAKNYLTEKLNSEILRYEKQILKAKSKLEALK